MCALTALGGISSDGKFRWRLTNVSVPSLDGGPDTWAPSLNDPAMFGKARLTLYPMVAVNPGEAVTWGIAGPYNLLTQQFPPAAIIGNTKNFSAVVTQGIYQVTLDIGTRVFSTNTVVVKNILIVSMGDSYACGDGNPELEARGNKPAQWADDKLRNMDPGQDSQLTHRTRYAAPFQAAFALDNELSDQAVELLFLARTGATVGDILWGQPCTPSQMDELNQMLASRQVDHFVVSIGGNDIYANGGLGGIVLGLLENVWWLGGASRTPNVDVNTLVTAYSFLDSAIRAKPNIRHVYLTEYPNPLTDSSGQYPDKQACDISQGSILGFQVSNCTVGFDIGDDDARWAQNKVLIPLNQHMRDACARYHWNYIGGMYQAFLGHGYPAQRLIGGEAKAYPQTFLPLEQSSAWCVKDYTDPYVYPWHPYSYPRNFALQLCGVTDSSAKARWIRTYSESVDICGPGYIRMCGSRVESFWDSSFGMYHPNTLGHAAMAGIIAKQVKASIQQDLSPTIVAANPNGPYLVNSGQPVLLSAAGGRYQPLGANSSAATSLAYFWDVGATGTFRQGGPMLTYNPGVISGAIPVNLLVVNTNTLDSSTASTYIQVTPTAPATSVTAPASVELGAPYQVQLSVAPLANGAPRNIVASRVEWGDGTTNGYYGSYLYSPYHAYVNGTGTNIFKVFVTEVASENAGVDWQYCSREWLVYTGAVMVVTPSIYGGSISGTVGNGSAAQPTAGAIVYLDANNNSVRDPGERWGVTDSNGHFAIRSVPDGTQLARVDVSSLGSSCSLGLGFSVPACSYYLIGITNASSANNINFFWNCTDGPSGWVIDATLAGDTPIGTNGASIQVRLFADANGNGKPDTGEEVKCVAIGPQMQVPYAFISSGASIAPDLRGTPLELVWPDPMGNGSSETGPFSGSVCYVPGSPCSSDWCITQAGPSSTNYEVSPFRAYLSPSVGESFHMIDTQSAPDGAVTNGSLPLSASALESTLGIPGALSSFGNPAEIAVQGRATSPNTFSALAGSVLAFDWNFITEEPTNRSDVAFALLSRYQPDAVGSVNNGWENVGLVQLADCGTTPTTPIDGTNLRKSGWRTGYLKVNQAGQYRVAFGVVDKTDGNGRSGLAVENLELIGTAGEYQACLDFYVRGGASQVTGRVWVDENGNGLRDDSEPPLSGVTVTLYNAGLDNQVGGGDDLLVASTQSDAQGQFTFQGLPRGMYYVQYQATGGYGLTVKGAGGDSRSSNADPQTGLSEPFPVRASHYIEYPMATNGGAAWQMTSDRNTQVVTNQVAGFIPDANRIVANLLGPAQTSENGAWTQVGVSLNRQPKQDVSVSVSSSFEREGTVSTNLLVFTPFNWNVPQIVKVSGQDDLLYDGDVTYQFIAGSTGSADPGFDGLPRVYLALTNLDNEGSLADDRLAGNQTITNAAFVGGGNWGLTNLVLTRDEREDWFSFLADRDGKVTIILSFDPLWSGSPRLDLYDSSSQALATSPSLIFTNYVLLSYGPVTAGQTFYLRVSTWDGIAIPLYTLTASFSAMVSFSGGPLIGAAPLTVNFTNNSSGGSTNVLWDFGDGATSMDQAPTHLYSTSAVYSVSLTIITGDGPVTGTQPQFVAVTNPAPVITSQPQPQTTAPGATVLFTVAASGSPPLTYQWLKDGLNLADGGRVGGATNATLIISNTAPGDSGGYSVVVSNQDGLTVSSLALLTVNPPPTITSQPLAQTALAGGRTSFSVLASGTTPISYQWLKNGQQIPGATLNALSLNIVQFTDAGMYSVAVSNAGGSVLSANARLGVSSPQNGDVDASFDTSYVINGTVFSAAIQPDGKVVIGGDFTRVNGMAFGRVARLNSDGSVDNNFQNAMSGADNAVRSLVLQPDGRLLIGGDFATVNGVNRGRVARLSSDGSVDTSFQNLMSGADNIVYSLALQTNGQVVIGGSFASVNGTSRTRVARLNSDGSVDNGFQNQMTGANNIVQALAIQPDEKVLLGGWFTTVNGTNRGGIARLNTNGTLDVTFQNGMTGAGGALHTVFSVAIQPDGKALIGGTFTTVNGTNCNYIARLNTNGSLDTSFLNGMAGADTWIQSVAADANGRVLLGGYFSLVDGTNRTRLARLNGDGSLDSSFQNGMSGANDTVYSVLPQSDGKILIAGAFTAVNGQSRAGIARLFGAQTNLPSANFTGSPTAGLPPLAVILTDSSSGTITNRFWNFGDGSVSNAAGTTTTKTFTSPGTNTVSLTVSGPFGGSTQTRTNFVIVGNTPPVAAFNGAPTNGMAPLTVTFTDLSSGAITNWFWDFGDGSSTNTTGGTVFKTYIAPGANSITLIVSGPGGTNAATRPGYISVAPAPAQPSFTADPTNGVAPLAVTLTDTSTGTITNRFWDFGDGTTLNTLDTVIVKTYSTPGTNTIGLSVSGPLGASSLLRTNLIVVAPAPPSIDVQPIAQTKPIGAAATLSVAASGSPPLSYQWLKNGTPVAAATTTALSFSNLQFSDGATYSVIVANVAGSTNSAEAQLMVNMRQGGDLDLSLNPGLTVDGGIYATVVQPDGKVIIGGNFGSVDGVNRGGIARINPDGSLDLSFQNVMSVTPGGSVKVLCVALQPDGKIVMGGQFNNAGGTNRYNIARLLSNGALDTAFQNGMSGVSSGNATGVYALVVQPDGRIIIGGDFTRVNSVALYRIARLNSNGGVDSSFLSGTSLNGSYDVVRALALQSDGNVVIGGDFSAFNGAARNHIARLTSTGALDTTFMAGLSGVDGTVECLGLQADGRVLIGGGFDIVNSEARNRIARLNQDGTLDNSFQNAMLGANDWVRTLALQTDGKLLVGGDFTMVDGVSRNRLARLNPDGSLDETFQHGLSGANNRVISVALQTNGAPLVAGDFTTFNDEPRNRIVQLYSSGPAYNPLIINQPSGVAVDWGSDVVLSAAAVGSVPLQYQWRKGGVLVREGGNIAGAMTPLLLLANAQDSDAGAYDLVVTNPYGSVTSSVANVVVRAAPQATLAAVAGSSNTFSVTASGTVPSTWWVLRAPNLGGPWTVIGEVGIGTNGPGAFTDLNPPANRAFYRVASFLSGPPVILTQPASLTNILGTAAAFSVIASGNNPLQYQWRKNAAAIAGATDPSYSIAAVQASDAGSYDVVLSNPYGSVTSLVAALTIVATPSITLQPQSRTNLQGTPVAFSVTANGTAALAYQWRKYGVPLVDSANISGATGAMLTLASVLPADAGPYDVVVTNAYGSSTSAAGILTVVTWPTISTQPQSQTNVAGTTVVFTVLASGTSPLAYQWRKNGASLSNAANVSGATSPALTLTSVQFGDAGGYDLVITNSYGAVASSVAILTVPAPPGISWQADFGGTDDDRLATAIATLDGGFILGGRTSSVGASGNKTNAIPAGAAVPLWWVVKTDGNGQKQWERSYGGNNYDTLYAIAQATNGDYFLAGWSSSPASGNKTVGTYGAQDYWLMRINSNGTPLWQTNFGGTGTDYCQTMVATSDGGCILGGYSDSPPSGNKSAARWGGTDYWLVKVDANGRKQWDKSYGGTNNEYLYDHSVQQTADGGYIVAGSSASGATGNKGIQGFGGLDFWILKLDANGNKVAENVFGGTGDEEPEAVRQTADGGFVVLGYSTSGATGSKATGNYGGKDIWLLKVDLYLSNILYQEWERDYGGTADDYVGDIRQTSDGGYLIGGTTFSSASGNMTSTSHGGQDFWLLRLDAGGNKVWENTYGGTNDDVLSVVQLLPSDGILLAGLSQSMANGNKSVGGYGNNDYWIMKLANEPVIAAPLNFQTAGGLIMFSWANAAFHLQSAPEATGIFTNVPGAISPYTVPASSGRKFFRLAYP
jgi:uncharacterized delta-60 repeat protein